MQPMTPHEVEAFKKFTCEYSTKTYTPNDLQTAQVSNNSFDINKGFLRNIPIETLEKGAIFFHYFKIPNRQYINGVAESDFTYSHRVMDTLWGQFGIPISWKDNIQCWEICFASTVLNYHYYYPNPCAGFGVNQFGREFNAAFICKTTRSSRWAYLKSGTTVNESIEVHRRYPITEHPDFDFKRLKLCNEIDETNACRRGYEYDICLTPEFQAEANIDGITCIAQMDDLMDITKSGSNYEYRTNDKPMFDVINSWYNACDTPSDHAIWAMNLLCLETDKKENRLNIGFREFACCPFGSKHANTTTIFPPFLPYPPGTYQLVNDGSKRKYYISDSNIVHFLNNYVKPHRLMKPIEFITPSNALDYTINGTPNLTHISATMSDALRNSLNSNIGQYLSNKPILFDILHNIFYFDNEELGETIPVKYMNIQGQVTPSYPKRWYKLPANNLNNLNKLQNLKIVKELFSNSKRNGSWMCEFQVYAIDGSPMVVPVGPFYNPLSMPIDSFNMINVYRNIINKLESNLYNDDPHTHSHTHNILNDYTYMDYIFYLSDYQNNTYVYNNIQNIQFLLGAWNRPAHLGGGRDPSQSFTKEFVNNFRRNFAKTMKTNVKTYKLKSNMNAKTYKNNKPKSNAKTYKNNKSKSNANINTNGDTKGGSTSNNIVPLTKDQRYILEYIQKDEHLGKLWKLIFN